jgi:oxygen-dependent protoporphyrinogen oxidase
VSTIVVGGGIAGLVRGFTLARRREEVRVLEASGRPGGVIRSERRDGFLLELGPNTVRPNPAVWRLLDELNLRDRALLADPRLPRYIDYEGRLHRLPSSPASLLSSRLLSAGGKLRLLSEPLRGRGGFPGETVAQFAARRLGREVAERLVAPFVSGIWAGDSERLSLSEAFPMLARWELEGGSIARGGLRQMRASRGDPAPGPKPPRGLLSFPEGLEELPRALAAELGERLHLRRSVRAVGVRGDRFEVQAGGDTLEADRVVLAAPAPESARLCASFAPEAAAALEAIPYAPVVVLHLSWPRQAPRMSLAGFGHLVVPGGGRRILGAVWASSLFAGRAPEGRILITVFLGGIRDPDAVHLPESELVRAARQDLEEQLGVRGDPQVVAVTRWERAIPQYVTGHRERVAALERAEREHPGLCFLGSYRGGISVGDVVGNAARINSPAAGPP